MGAAVISHIGGQSGRGRCKDFTPLFTVHCLQQTVQWGRLIVGVLTCHKDPTLYWRYTAIYRNILAIYRDILRYTAIYWRYTGDMLRYTEYYILAIYWRYTGDILAIYCDILNTTYWRYTVILPTRAQGICVWDPRWQIGGDRDWVIQSELICPQLIHFGNRLFESNTPGTITVIINSLRDCLLKLGPLT